jgi:hypothetical protein
MTECYACGADDHYRKDCPGSGGQAQGFARPAASISNGTSQGVPGVCLHCGLPGHQGCASQAADYPAAAARARELLNMPRPAVAASEFRARYGIPARSEEEYRAIARQQVAEFRAQRIAL